jgi:transcriptional regulator with AAA-type ATPase domain
MHALRWRACLPVPESGLAHMRQGNAMTSVRREMVRSDAGSRRRPVTTSSPKRPGTSSDPGFGGKPRRLDRQPFLLLVLQASRPLEGGARFCLTGIDEVFVGRGDRLAAERHRDGGRHRLALAVNSRAMSGKHARFHRTSNGWVVEDAGSKNGVFINGQRIGRPTVLHADDLVTLGYAFFRIDYFDTDDASDLIATEVTRAIPGTLTLSPSYYSQLANLASIAPTRTPITLVGETGVGKEFVAQAIHTLSGRTGPYSAVNCAGLARTLIESELFGYVKGAFSGASKNHPGHVQAADGGTLLLDEILAAPPELQTALLRVLQEGLVVPVGGRTPIRVDTRFVAATQRSLDEAVTHEGFRSDLKARLEGFVLTIPPLRERTADIGIFVAHALRAHGAGEADTPGFTLQAALRLLRHRFPGNVRELANAVGRAKTLARGALIGEEHLLLPDSPNDDRESDPEQVKQSLVANLRLTRGDVPETARRMGRNRTLIYKWIDRFGIDLNDFRNA